VCEYIYLCVFPANASVVEFKMARTRCKPPQKPQQQRPKMVLLTIAAVQSQLGPRPLETSSRQNHRPRKRVQR